MAIADFIGPQQPNLSSSRLVSSGGVLKKSEDYSPRTLQFRYPSNVASPPFEKWILFEVRTGRHVLRDTLIQEIGNNLDRTLASVALYLPGSALVDTLTMKYDENAALGQFGGMAAELYTQDVKNSLVRQALGTDSNDNGGLGGSLVRVVGKIGTLIHDLAAKTKDAVNSNLTEFIKSDALAMLPTSLQNAGTAATGVRPNPRTDILFDTQQYRNHTLTFTMIPRNLSEAQAIDDIVHLFQFYMLPAYLNQGNVGSMLIGFPYEFEITLNQYAQEMEHVNKIGRSVLTSIAIDHTAGQEGEGKVAFVKAASGELFPVVTNMILTFTEVRLLGRDSAEINRGINNQKRLDDPRLRASN